MENKLVTVVLRRNTDIESAIQELTDVVLDSFDFTVDPEETLFNIGLEPDYIDDLLDLVSIVEDYFVQKGIEDFTKITNTQVNKYLTGYINRLSN